MSFRRNVLSRPQGGLSMVSVCGFSDLYPRAGQFERLTLVAFTASGVAINFSTFAPCQRGETGAHADARVGGQGAGGAP